jgi:hypothetical protein
MLKSKQSVVRLLRLGFFGNTLRTWAAPSDMPKELWKDQSLPWSLRSLKPGGQFIHRIPFKEMLAHWTPDYYVCEPADDNDVLIQGEIFRCASGLHLTFSYAKTTLREAMRRHTLRANGIDVHQVLRPVMSPESWDEIMDCLDLGGSPVVEFTVFNHYIGDRPWRNTIIWEVREY